LTKDEGVVNLSVSRAEAGFSGSLREAAANDFEAVVARLEPLTARARDALLGAGASWAMLSGSGSSVFGVFDSKGEAGRAREVLRASGGWRVFACATLTRAEYLLALGRCAAVLLPDRGA
jgi:4-diphosphocytidyl-2C-methyl-D-erythritol kinase